MRHALSLLSLGFIAVAAAATGAVACGDDGGPACDCAAEGCYADACTKAVFATATVTLPDFGGLAGADKLCQDAATKAGLAGTFKAWLSDANSSPSTRFSKSTVPYQMVGGVELAASWDELVGQGPNVAIDVDQNGQTIADAMMNALVWSNTGRDGRPENYGKASAYCQGWTSTALEEQAVVGWLTKRGEVDDWTFAVVTPCSASARLYCFQQ